MVNVSIDPWVDGGLVGVTIVLTQFLKQYVNKAWVPLIPVVLAFLITAPAVIIAAGGWPGVLMFLSRWAVESLKIFSLAMTAFDLGAKTGRAE